MASMNDIYDVFRMLVNSQRATMPDKVITEAIEIIDRADQARYPMTQLVEDNAAIAAKETPHA
jgi:hypothetical protein